MNFAQTLIPATLLRRYKRFFADVRLADGTEVTAHAPNPGAMLGMTDPGLPVWLSRSDDPKRKLSLTLEMVGVGGARVGVNTLIANRLAEEAILTGLVPELSGYPDLRREVRYDENSRIDFLLTGDARPPAYVEVKSVTLSREPGLAEFPDCRTERGLKHIGALRNMVRTGARGVLLFVIQRDDCTSFDTADDLDPAYAAALRDAAAHGVEVLCYACHLDDRSVRLDRPAPWRSAPARP